MAWQGAAPHISNVFHVSVIFHSAPPWREVCTCSSSSMDGPCSPRSSDSSRLAADRGAEHLKHAIRRAKLEVRHPRGKRRSTFHEVRDF